MSIKISTLYVENVKAVKAVYLEPTQTGLTVIGGKNRQGKTSLTDAIAWALGGGKREPSNPQHDGAMNPPKIEITLNNGLVVRRDGKGGTLKVIDQTGARGTQGILDSFIPAFALDLPKFLNASAKEKAQILLQILGIGDQLTKLDEQEKTLYAQRTAVGQLKTAKEKYAEELPEYPDAPHEPVSISDLIQRQQTVLAKNGENQQLRTRAAMLQQLLVGCQGELEKARALVQHLEAKETQLLNDLLPATKSAKEVQDESTAELEAQIADFETLNQQVSANLAKGAARDEAEQHKARYDGMTVELEAIRAARLALLDGADLPLPGLTVVDGDLLFNGKQWDCMSGAEQLQVGVAIVRKLKPECGFVLVDKLEQFDIDTLREFGEWAEAENLQIIATRVSTGSECSIIIEDGLPTGQSFADVVCRIKPQQPDTGTAIEEW